MSNLNFSTQAEYNKCISESVRYILRDQKAGIREYLSTTLYGDIDRNALVNSEDFMAESEADASSMTTYLSTVYDVLRWSNNQAAIDDVDNIDTSEGFDTIATQAAYYAVIADLDAELERLTIDDILDILDLTEADCLQESEDIVESLDEPDTTLAK
jgi:hypothetical protein